MYIRVEENAEQRLWRETKRDASTPLATLIGSRMRFGRHDGKRQKQWRAASECSPEWRREREARRAECYCRS